jgi:hypothetical protein
MPQWLDKLDVTEQSSLVDFAVHCGAKARLLWAERGWACCIACARKLELLDKEREHGR